MQARYADGRAAVTTGASIEFTDEGVLIVVGGETHVWPYNEIRRADDNEGPVILKRRPDTGQRLTIAREELTIVRAAAPQLFKGHAREIEPLGVIVGLAVAAWALAVLFLIGVPLEAKPIAQAMPAKWRSQISAIEWSQMQQFTDSCDDADEATRILNTLTDRIMLASHVPQRRQVWITIVRAPIANAFTLPDNQILITNQLIAMADDPDEIAGVLSHEIGHVELNHVMTNVVRHIGAGVFFDVVFGGGGLGQAVALASVNLSGLSFSREDEFAADKRGLDYLDAAGIDPGGLARLFERFGETQESAAPRSRIGSLLANHPPTAERAALARSRARAGRAPSLTPVQWRIVQRACGGSTARRQAQRPAAPTPPAPAPEPKESAKRP